MNTLQIAPRAVHDLTKYTLVTIEGQGEFSRKLVACCLDHEQCFKLVTICVNYDTATEDYTRNDFRDPVDGLVMAAMQDFYKVWLTGNPWPASRQQWAQAVMPHLKMFFQKNPTFPQGFMQEAVSRIVSLPLMQPGDLDLIFDGLVDYITGHRYLTLEGQLSKLDPAAKKELLENTPRSIRVPGAEVEIQNSIMFLDALFTAAAKTKPFYTDVHTFDKTYGAKAQPGDAWLGFANPGGGKTNAACQWNGVSVEKGNHNLMITTEVLREVMLMRAFCAARKASYKGIQALRGSDPRHNNLGKQFVEWVANGPGQNLHIVDYRNVPGADFREKLGRIIDAYYRKLNRFPDMVTLDWIGGSLDASFKDSWAKREAYEQVAVRMARLADELGCVTLSLAQAKKECKNKSHLTDQDTADCSSLSQPMEGVFGMTSLLETGGEQLNGESQETHKTRQYWCVCKCREAEALRIPVDRRFEEMRFMNAT
jgi:hypothetical protein